MTNIFIYEKNNYYVHWGVCVTLIVLLLLSWFSTNKKAEGFDVTMLDTADDNPQIQQKHNPVPDMIDVVGGTKYYPLSYPRRVNSIMDPMTERKIHRDMVTNTGNLFTVNITPKKIDFNQPLTRVLYNPPY